MKWCSVRFESTAFSVSVHDPGKMPPSAVPEIAFIGRSNAGKSSALNALTGRRRLAFVSKTPGRTQLVNFFSIGCEAFLVDLPGYGYAGVPLELKRHWEFLVGGYLRTRKSLVGLIVVMDARHPLSPADRTFLAWLSPAERKVHVLLTKSDKLSDQVAQRTLASTREEIESVYSGASVQIFSSLRRKGIELARETIAQWVRNYK